MQEQLGLNVENTTVNTSISCLGLIFPNDELRREYFIEKLREKLKDPKFRELEGFPIGSDDDILALSDPPYYTACPNPWIRDFIVQWEEEKPLISEDHPYLREPYAADVSEGKNEPIYNAHSYHTKVPHKAIMRYILHYTDPGDIVFDGFCGTGMTGVAAQMCGDRESILSLGYQVKSDGTILREEMDENGKNIWAPFSRIGARRVILNDLSPAATFIAHHYNSPVEVEEFEREAKLILKEVQNECGWMYETLHTDAKSKGRINYVVWSDVFICVNCLGEVVFWEAAVDKNKGEVNDEFVCPHCNTILTKRRMKQAWTTRFDTAIGTTIRQTKQIPVLINYSVGSKKFEKIPDEQDFVLIKKIEDMDTPYWFPKDELPDGYNTRQPKGSHGITHIHHFYTKRNLLALSKVQSLIKKNSKMEFLITGFLNRATKLNQLHIKYYFFGGGGCNAGHRKGTLYVPSISMETPIIELFEDRIKTQVRSLKTYPSFGKNIISTSSANAISESKLENVFDYIFIDPPFGSNINYSELSFLWEGWLSVFTNNIPEAIENTIQEKGPNEYRKLMEEAFRTFHIALKPGKWITIEFSNTNAYVWNIIQNALENAGFIIGNVSSLDKKQGGMATIRSSIAVLKDLVISAYKPNGGFEERFSSEAEKEEGVWDFVRTHLKYLPIIKKQAKALATVPERDSRLLFDQMVAYYVRNGFTIPLSSQEFQDGLRKHFPERDGMYFLPEQVTIYDKQRMLSDILVQANIFVTDEASAIQWLYQLLRDKPQTTQDIHPQFIQETQRAWNKHETQLELGLLLDQNFLCYDGQGEVPSQIHSYLSTNFRDLRNLAKDDLSLRTKAKDRWYVPDPNKAADLEKIREKALLRWFEEYRLSAQRKLKVFRLEAIRAGFKKAWAEKNYQTIVEVGSKLPDEVLQEDNKLLMYYDNAQIRIG